jgi:hypothetical protein
MTETARSHTRTAPAEPGRLVVGGTDEPPRTRAGTAPAQKLFGPEAWLRAFAGRQRVRTTRYFRVLARSTNRALDPMEESFTETWPSLVVISMLVAIPVTGCVRGAHMLTVSSDNLWLVCIGLLPGMMISFASLTALAWASVRRNVQPERAYVVGLLASAVATLVTVEWVAGVTTALWHAGEISSQPDAAPSLWASERYYVWHLLQSFPFFDLERSFGWTEPNGYLGVVAGGAVIALRVVLLLPLARLGISGYWWLRTKPHTSGWSDGGAPWIFVAWALVAALLTYGCLVAIWSPDSLLSRVLDDHLPGRVELWQQTLSLGWIEEAAQWICLAALIWFCGLLGGGLLMEVSHEHDEIRSLVAIFVGTLLLLAVGAVLAGASTLLLVNSGLAHSVPAVPAGAPVTVAVESQLWGLADAIPFLNIPRTVHWERPYAFSGWPVGLVSVTFKLFAVAALLTVPWLSARLVALLRRVDDEPVIAINSARDFAAALASLHDELRRASAMRRDHDDHAAGYHDVLERLSQLEVGCRRVGDAFGPGLVSDAAAESLAAAEDRVRGVIADGSSPRTPGPPEAEGQSDFDTTLLSTAETFVSAATAAMEEAVPPMVGVSLRS